MLVQYYLVGGYSGAAGNEPVVVQQGDISCLDLAYGFETVAAQPFENINVLIPPQLWLARSDSARIPHGSVIRANGACARIQATLSQFMAEASGLDAAEAVALSVALVDMLAGSFRPTALADRGGTLDRTRMLRDYLHRHLGDPQLCASRVASALDFGVMSDGAVIQPVTFDAYANVDYELSLVSDNGFRMKLDRAAASPGVPDRLRLDGSALAETRDA